MSATRPPPLRARARWQPYSSLTKLSSDVPPDTPSRGASSPPPYLPTPASSVCSSNTPYTQAHVTSKTTPLTSQAQSLRDLQIQRKKCLVMGLVYQAIRSLCDTWLRPSIIPATFAYHFSPPLDSSPPLDPRTHLQGTLQNPQQLLSSIYPSPRTATATSSSDTFERPNAAVPVTNAAPIKHFVLEVLRRSGVSTGVLQVALCYLEAVRRRLPEVLRKENDRAMSGHSGAEEETYLDRITVETVTEDSVSNDHTEVDAARTLHTSDDTDSVVDKLPFFGRSAAPTGYATSEIKRDAVLPPLPPQSSPLLCPRRTFLACMILASKFMQDHPYSNRAWAKLAGLPPREIARCERAVGNVLEWRLWVGKDLNAGACHGRSLLCSRSDSDVLTPAAPSVPRHAPYLTPPPTPYSSDIASPAEFIVGPRVSRLKNTRSHFLRPCVTVPSVGAEPPASYGVQIFSSVLMKELAPSEVHPLALDSRFPAPYAGQVPSPQSSRFPLSYVRTSACAVTSEVLDNHTGYL